MVNISDALTVIIEKEKCSPFCAFLKLMEGGADGLSTIQSKPGREPGGRLCNKGNNSRNG